VVKRRSRKTQTNNPDKQKTNHPRKDKKKISQEEEVNESQEQKQQENKSNKDGNEETESNLGKKIDELIIDFPRENGAIRLKVKTLNLIYIAELIDIYTEHFPEFYKPLMQKILQDLPELVEVTEDSLPIDHNLLSSPIPYTPGKTDCNPLTFAELRKLIDEIIAYASIMPSDDWTVRLAETDATQYYDDVFRPNNTFFTFRDDKLVVLKVDPIDFLDAADILDKIQAQQNEMLQAQQIGRKPKLILTQKWLFETLIPRFPELLTCHPKSPVKIDVSKTGSFDIRENPLTPFEINKLIDKILKVSGVLPEQIDIFH